MLDILEQQILDQHGAVIGVDEAGRGCLAGPVYVAAVLVSSDRMTDLLTLKHLTDSKQLTARRRENLLADFLQLDIPWRMSVISPAIIDRINILQAARLGMHRSVKRIPVPAHLNPLVAVDGNQPIDTPWPQQTIIKGDLRFKSIGMASVIAKVMRDRFMTAVDRAWPQYGFAGHKGYPAPNHREALKQNGPCPIHRRSFRGVLPDLDRSF